MSLDLGLAERGEDDFAHGLMNVAFRNEERARPQQATKLFILGLMNLFVTGRKHRANGVWVRHNYHIAIAVAAELEDVTIASSAISQ